MRNPFATMHALNPMPDLHVVGSEEDFEGDEETKSRSGASRSRAKSVDSARSSMARTARTSEWAHSRVFSDEEEEGQGAR